MPMQTTKERFDAANEAVKWGEERRNAEPIQAPRVEEGTATRIAREIREGQAAQDKGARQAEGIKKAGQMDWGATAPAPPRLKGVAIQRHSLTETDKSLPWAEFSTPEGPVKVAQGSMFPGTNYTLTYLGSEPDERGIPQLQAEFTSGTGENFIVGGGRSGEAEETAPYDWDSNRMAGDLAQKWHERWLAPESLRLVAHEQAVLASLKNPENLSEAQVDQLNEELIDIWDAQDDLKALEQEPQFVPSPPITLVPNEDTGAPEEDEEPSDGYRKLEPVTSPFKTKPYMEYKEL